MKIAWQVSSFEDLKNRDIYEILQLRSQVFVVEQNCIYQDIDGKDKDAMHLIGSYNQHLVAYARLFDKNKYFDTAAIGRVVVSEKYRQKKIGHKLMDKAIEYIKVLFSEETITISAQYYLLDFYSQHHFTKEGEQYLEDGIPHIKMIKR